MKRSGSVRGFLRSGHWRRLGVASHSEKLHRRAFFETLETRHLLSITLPTLADQTVLAGAPLSVALDTSGTSNAVNYTISVTNASLTNPTVSNPQLTASVPQGNPSLRMVIDDAEDNIHGEMVFQLAEDLAPETVDQIMSLANSGFYNGLDFHRVIKNFMIQGGDPSGDGTGGPGFEFDSEINASLQFTSSGILAMANSGADTNGSQFFITSAPYRYGDFRYTIFGFLTEGNDILQQISNIPVHANAYGEVSSPDHTVTLTSVSVFTDIQDAVLRFSTPNGTTGAADVTVTATDSVTGDSATSTFHVTVAADNTNDPPFLESVDPIHVAAGTPVSFDIPAIDVEGDAILYDAYVAPDGANPDLSLTVDSSTGHVTLTPTAGAMGVYSVVVGVLSPTSGTWDLQSVPVYISPAAPSSVSLLPTSNSGASNSDDVTNLNNAAGAELQFQVDGVLDGALVELFADGTLVGQTTATGTSVVIATSGATTLTDGIHAISARQTLSDQAVHVGNLDTTTDLVSQTGAPLSIRIDTAPAQFYFRAATTAVLNVPYHCLVTATDTPASDVTYELLSSIEGMTIDSATGEIAWTPSEGQEPSVEVSLRATDLAGNTSEYQYTINVLATNAAPVLVAANPSMGSTDEDTAITIALTTLINGGEGTTSVTDSDDGAVVGGIALIGTAGNGTWEYSLDGVTFLSFGTVSNSSALLLPQDAVFRYTPDSRNGESTSITYRAWDTTGGASGTRADLSETDAVGGATAFSNASDTASLLVTDVNDAPVLTPVDLSLGSVNFNTTTTKSLSTLINNGSGTTGIADVDEGAVLGGIAVIGSTGYGTWQYSIDGENFIDLGTVREETALLLAANAQLRYVPDGSHTETATITYRAWDTTTGENGSVVDASISGEATAFSTAVENASLSITDPNTAPVLTPAVPPVGGDPRLGRTTPSVATTISLAAFIGDTIADADPNAVIGGIALTGVTGHGTWAYSTDGTNFTDVGTVSESSALLLPKDAVLRYTPDGTSEETATITYRAWDTTTGQAGDKLDTGTNGGGSAFSTALDSAGLLVRSISISGLVYVDANNDGNYLTSTGAPHRVLPGTIVKLFSKDAQGNWTEVAGKSPVMTGADGSYQFDGLAVGTYRVEEVQPVGYLDGMDTAGTVASGKPTAPVPLGTTGADQFELQLGVGDKASGYNFGERGLKPAMISLRYSMASTLMSTELITMIDAAPVVTLSAAVPTFETGGSPAAIALSATIADADSPMLAWLTATITNLRDGASEKLAADTSGSAITSSYADGLLTLSGVADRAEYERVLRTLTYSDIASSPTLENRSIQIVADDGITSSAPATVDVSVKLAAVDAALESGL